MFKTPDNPINLPDKCDCRPKILKSVNNVEASGSFCVGSYFYLASYVFSIVLTPYLAKRIQSKLCKCLASDDMKHPFSSWLHCCPLDSKINLHRLSKSKVVTNNLLTSVFVGFISVSKVRFDASKADRDGFSWRGTNRGANAVRRNNTIF